MAFREVWGGPGHPVEHPHLARKMAQLYPQWVEANLQNWKDAAPAGWSQLMDPERISSLGPIEQRVRTMMAEDRRAHPPPAKSIASRVRQFLNR